MPDLARVAILGAAAAGLAGCGSPNFEPGTANAVVAQAALPVPTSSDMVSERRSLGVGPGDVLDIAVFGLNDLTRELRVDPTGAIQYPLVGRVDVLGLTPAQIGDRIGDGLRGRYLRDPQVTVTLSEANSQRVTVGGAVRQPGIYPLLDNATLSQVVARGGGLTEYARQDEVVVFRTVAGQRYAARFSISDIYGGRAVDPELYPNDQVVVGSDANRAMLRDIAPLTPILGLFYQIF